MVLHLDEYRFGESPVGRCELAARLEQPRVKLHVFSHHASYGKMERTQTTFVNASIRDYDYPRRENWLIRRSVL